MSVFGISNLASATPQNIDNYTYEEIDYTFRQYLTIERNGKQYFDFMKAKSHGANQEFLELGVGYNEMLAFSNGI